MNGTEAEKLGDKLVKECEAFSLCILDGNGSPHLSMVGFERYCVLQVVTEQWTVYNEGEMIGSALQK